MIEYKKELKRIIEASQNNTLTFFVGAGVSALSGAPKWKDLINAICNKLGLNTEGKYSFDECLKIPQMFYDSLKNEKKYNEFVKEQLYRTDLHPNDIHKEMLKLNPVSFITTNYDSLLEDAVLQHYKIYKVITQDKDLPKIDGDRFILKVHGDISTNNFVLKEEDYLSYSEKFKLIETFTKTIFSTNTVVFIGYGLNDYNIKLIVNWTKSLLGNDFSKPIFIYTDDDLLTEAELSYYESKGFSVIDWHNILLPYKFLDSYKDRYKIFFNDLLKYSKLSLVGKTEDEAFNILFDLLQPLKELDALRIEDIEKQLPSDSYIRIFNHLILFSEDNFILRKFFYIDQIIETNNQNNLDKEVVDKYKCILEVFKKALIFGINYGNRVRCFEDVPFADMKCIMFDYASMQKFSEKEFSNIKKKYKKAFYLFQLKRYEDALSLFDEVAKQAFIDKNYLLYYLAKTNWIRLNMISSSVEALALNKSEIENLFRSLPVKFRNTYDILKDIHSVNILYNYSYNAFIDGQKLQNVIESGAYEGGMTSGMKVIYRIYDYLHFMQGNGIIVESLPEYRNTVKSLMSILVYKYSNQKKKVLNEQKIPFLKREIIPPFNEVDFYCFINCFDGYSGIQRLFDKYQIETIEFKDMARIEISVNNLLDYYEDMVKTSKNNNKMIIGLQMQIQNCLSLLRYIDISQNLVDKVIRFIFTYGFFIDNELKLGILTSQLKCRNMYSNITAKIIKNKLIDYIDKNITALENGEDPKIKYCYQYLVRFVFMSGNKNVTCLSNKVAYILREKLTSMYSDIAYYYIDYISKNQKKQLIPLVKKQLVENFSFELFTILVKCETNISKIAKEQLKSFLKKEIENNKKDKSFEALNMVGSWFLFYGLEKQDFKEFLGNSPEFDFYYEYEFFDFRRFDVSWLLNITPEARKEIAKNKIVKEKIRIAIATELNNKTLVETDANKLLNILCKYFC